jgi:transcriptional regulator GlxA family with amidase domain
MEKQIMSITPLTPKVSVGILLFPSVEELDFAGPYEVFANANDEQEQLYCQVVTVGTTREIRCHRNLRVSCDYLLEDCPRLDLLVVPGGPAARANDENTRHLVSFLKQQHEQGTTMTSVCTGAFLLAAAGLLDQRRATTHTGFQKTLQQTYPSVQVLTEKVVDEGDVITAGGVVSGIDLALHCLEKWFGPEARGREARRLDGPWL